MLTVRKIVEQTEKIAPPSLALPDDPIGLQVGSMEWQVRRLMLALDAGPDTIGQAVNSGADMLLTHHPLFYKSIRNLNLDTMAGRAVALAIEKRVAIYSAHTNLDAAPRGINRALAELLTLQNVQAFGSTDPARLKLVTFVPDEALERVRQAIFNLGHGTIGEYSKCSFTTPGEGTFLGSEGTDPAVGRTGRFEKVREVRLEIIIEERNLRSTIEVLKGAHPYEEPTVDLYPLFPLDRGNGLGLVGDLDPGAALEDLAQTLLKDLGASAVRWVGRKGTVIRRVALCAGSGASLLEDNLVKGSDLFITGDIRYHDARRAQEAGLALLDIGHFAPERFGMEFFGRLLDVALKGLDETVEIVYAVEENPFITLTAQPCEAEGKWHD
ncbi:MAG: Nif3-like dinuclear metal center hexameric protein [Deltaproteobacteria bacterium]|nr:Nif3-like dinuclear metal center hexameric protein [Deltaproteobacteria bacterium]